MQAIALLPPIASAVAILLFPTSFRPGKPFLSIFGASVAEAEKPTLFPSAFPTVSSPLQALIPCLEDFVGEPYSNAQIPVPFYAIL